MRPEDLHSSAADIWRVDVVEDAHQKNRADVVVKGEQGPEEVFEWQNGFDQQFILVINSYELFTAEDTNHKLPINENANHELS